MHDDRTTGTATAASIRSTGAPDAAVAFDRIEVALLLCAIDRATLRWLTTFEEPAEPERG